MSPERRYRLLLLSYPRSYRAQRAEEMLDVLLAIEDRRDGWSGVSEAASLVGHGLALRLHRPVVGPRVSPALALAGASLVCLLAVLGIHQLLAAGLRGFGLDGYPDAWGVHTIWVDPRWPVQALWVATGLALLFRRHRLLVASAWAAAALHGWLFLVASVTTVDLPWPGYVGPHWYAYSDSAEASWLVLSLAAAMLLGGPGRAARSAAGLSSRSGTALAAGLVGSVLAATVAPVTIAAFGADALRLAEDIRGPALPLALAAAVLAHGLLRLPHGRGALVLLAMLAAVPFAARWSEPMSVLATAVAVVAAGCAVAWRGRREAVSSRPL